MSPHRLARALLLLTGLCVCPLLSAQDYVAADYTEALRSLAAGEEDRGIDSLKTLIERAPQFERAYAKLIEIYRRRQRLDELQQYFVTLRATSPDSPYPPYALALLAKEHRNREEFERYLRESISLSPAFAPAYTELIRIVAPASLDELEAEIVSAQSAAPSSAALAYALGTMHLRKLDFDSATNYLNESIRLDPNLGEPYPRLVTLHYYLRDFDAALPLIERMVALAEQSRDLELQGRALGRLGDFYLETTDYPRAMEHLERSVAIAQELADDRSLQAYLPRIGIIQKALGHLGSALNTYEESLGISQRIGDRMGEGRNIGLIGSLHSDLANYPEALRSLGNAAEIARELGDRTSEASQLSNMGLVYGTLGEYEAALDHIDQALTIAREAKVTRLQGRFLLRLGTIYEQLNDPERALEAYQQSAQIAKTAGDLAEQARGLNYSARTQAQLGNLTEAQGLYDNALRIAGEVGAVVIEGQILSDLGALQWTRNAPEAGESYRAALAIAEKARLAELEWQAHAGLAAVYASKDSALALEHYDQAVGTIETIRSDLSIAEDKAGFLANKIDVYRDAVSLLVNMSEQQPTSNYASRAFRYSELARARAFLDLMAEAKARPDTGLASASIERERVLHARLSRAQAKLIEAYSSKKDSAATIASLEKEMDELDREALALRRTIHEEHPDYAAIQYPDPIDLEALQAQLEPHQAMLEYMVDDGGSFLFAVTADDFQTFVLPGTEELRSRLDETLEVLSTGRSTNRSGFLLSASWLYQKLVGPAAKLLENKTELVVVPDGILHYLPFQVLLEGGGRPDQSWSEFPYLARRFAIGYSPSASLYVALQSPESAPVTQTAGFLGVGDPVYSDAGGTTAASSTVLRSALSETQPWKFARLEHSREEVTGIGALFEEGKRSLLLGAEATEANLKTHPRLEELDYLHFATHGILDDENPQFSGLALSVNPPTGASEPSGSETAEDPELHEDGLLQVYEIFKLRLNARLVVLSACETGLGKQVRGEGIVGMTRAFMYAGSPAVAVSLWRVADQTTRELMLEFYEQMQKPDVSHVEALGHAQRAMMSQSHLAHPYYWAPFVLIGRP